VANEILTVAQMYAADRYTAEHGVPSLTLMENAGRAVADEICKRWTPRPTAVLCGPGNNGGDGFVVARLLKERGWDVWVAVLNDIASLKGDAAEMAKRWNGETVALPSGRKAELFVDALFGAGLSRPLDGAARHFAESCDPNRIVAIDVPSGLHGDTGKPLGDVSVRVVLTVTFFRKKPAHVLMPGHALCGEVVVADIGISDVAVSSANLFENGPELWGAGYPWPRSDGHKYSRGHCVVVSGPMHATGAARLAAGAALRIGAGLVTVASPPDAVEVNAAHLMAIMIKPFLGAAGLAELFTDKRFNSVVIGPGCGVGRQTQEMVAAVLETGAAVTLDADALTSFRDDPAQLFQLLREPAVLTPHEGEFERLFKGVLASSENKVEAVRAAAAAAGCTVLLKGPDTVIARPDGVATVNTHAPPTLATAGSGDVLAGLIGGLMAQRLDSYRAASAAVWLHGEAAFRFGPGLISEDLQVVLPAVLKDLKDRLDEQYRNPPRGRL
jgi:NAD(P)H-hydrate epimerase